MPQVIGNADKLTQVIWNLLSNANEHTKKGEITISAKSENGVTEVCVSDTGEGIAPELLPRIFERHIKGDGGNTGIGLSICCEIIEAHGGRIWFESEQRKGAAVRFTLQSAERNGDNE